LIEAARQHKPALLTLLDDGAPWVPCASCGGRLFWADAREPWNRARWHCEHCRPPPPNLLRHACALPPQAPQC